MLTQILTWIAASGVGGLIGTLLTLFDSTRREKSARQREMKLRKLTEFYAPLLGLREEIRAKSELRVKLQTAIDSAHFTSMLQSGPNGVEAASDAHLPTILANIKDENQTFREVLMPRYRDMVKIFRDNMWLAELDTRNHFPALVEFVDVWDKIIDDKLPPQIAPAIGHTEANLNSFYANLATTHDRLRRELGL